VFCFADLAAEVLPLYGNTHTTTSATGMQSTFFREESRQLIKQAVNASEEDALIFTGSGSTGAIARLRDALRLEQYDGGEGQRAVVLTSPFEHHSNLLPWREGPVDVVTVRATETGAIDMGDLRRRLRELSGRPMVIGSFSAASNVTGCLTDLDAVATTLHEHGALAFFDFACAGPYVEIDMNRIGADDGQGTSFDAIFLSPHKFIGGVNTPGVLVAKRRLFTGVPSVPGGGAVFFVTEDSQTYLAEVEHREEAGTPDIVGSVRAGLVFQLKDAVGVRNIRRREHAFASRAHAELSAHPNIQILGPGQDVERLAIFSFMVLHTETGLYLHHNFVAALLNDLFGIQARGGCMCAAPYTFDLLGIPLELANRLRETMLDVGGVDSMLLRERDTLRSSKELLRPGFTRLNVSPLLP